MFLLTLDILIQWSSSFTVNGITAGRQRYIIMLSKISLKHRCFFSSYRTNSISDISYVFQVTSLSPGFGSLYGGTDLLIMGEGFSSNSSEMEITLGPHTCDITSVTNNQIECRIADTGTTHIISATGTHKSKLSWRISRGRRQNGCKMKVSLKTSL